jgi:hypothetical protein
MKLGANTLLKEAQTFQGQCEPVEPKVEVLTPAGVNQSSMTIFSPASTARHQWHFERETYPHLVDRLQAGRMRLEAEGKRQAGRLPFGQHPDHRCDAERAVLAPMLEPHRSGQSAYAICRIVSSEVITRRLGNQWQEMTVRRNCNEGHNEGRKILEQKQASMRKRNAAPKLTGDRFLDELTGLKARSEGEGWEPSRVLQERAALALRNHKRQRAAQDQSLSK